MEALMIAVGLVFGIISTWLIAKYKYKSERGISPGELEDRYVSKELYERINQDIEDYKSELEGKENEIIELNKANSSNSQIIKNLNEKLVEHKKDVEDLQKKFKIEFENIANKLFEEKSEKFLQLNKNNLDIILNPLKEKIEEFKGKVTETYDKESRERISLKEQIKHLLELNKQVSDDANKLAKALKGESKTQGDWGEIQLELILEKAGLMKNIHYSTQVNFKDEEGLNKRPDYIIHLPDKKNLILDSKVSLTAYENYFNAESDEDRSRYLNEHILSISNHIKELSDKNYQNLFEINQPDYVMLFMPIEPALSLAVREDIEIFEKALDKNIVLVSPSTLLATLRTISYIWTQENQKKHVFEIANESGAMYDKFKNFVDDLIDVGRKLNSTKDSYELAMNKLTEGKGNLIKRAEKIKALGAKASKSLPENILNRSIEE